MKRIIGSILFLLLGIGCVEPYSPEYELVERNIWVELNPRLPEDNNGYYHLELNENSWQTLHRLSGTAYHNDEPLEVLKVYWLSSHYWYLGDTLGYIVDTYLHQDQGEYVAIDTAYITGFNGMEVPTINPASYSNSDGEVNTMFAPVQSMEGDTATIRMYFFDEWNFEYVQEVFYIVLN